MFILFFVIMTLLAAVLLLRGEGDRYGKGSAKNNERKKVEGSNRDFFL